MTRDERAKCHAIIHAASGLAASVGAGLAQVPCSDNAVITPIQLSMTIGLGQVFGITLTDTTALAAIGSATAAMVGRTISQVVVGWIPGLGNVINASTAAGVTECLGWVLATQFAKQAKERDG